MCLISQLKITSGSDVTKLSNLSSNIRIHFLQINFLKFKFLHNNAESETLFPPILRHSQNTFQQAILFS